MSQQTPSPRRKFDRPRFNRRFSRATINVAHEIGNLVAGVPREIRFICVDDGNKIKPTILIELPAVGDDEQQ